VASSGDGKDAGGMRDLFGASSAGQPLDMAASWQSNIDPDNVVGDVDGLRTPAGGARRASTPELSRIRLDNDDP